MSHTVNESQRKKLVSIRLRPDILAFLATVHKDRTKAIELCVEAARNARGT